MKTDQYQFDRYNYGWLLTYLAGAITIAKVDVEDLASPDGWTEFIIATHLHRPVCAELCRRAGWRNVRRDLLMLLRGAAQGGHE